MTVPLRCAGPLNTLRCLAALYGCPARTFQAELTEAARALVPARGMPEMLAERIGRPARHPSAIHFFALVRTPDPGALLETGVEDPRGELIRELLLRSFDRHTRPADGEIPCVVEFARLPRMVDDALAAACTYVEAASRGASVRRGLAFDGSGTVVPASAVVSVRALDGTEREWAPRPARGR